MEASTGKSVTRHARANNEFTIWNLGILELVYRTNNPRSFFAKEGQTRKTRFVHCNMEFAASPLCHGGFDINFISISVIEPVSILSTYTPDKS